MTLPRSPYRVSCRRWAALGLLVGAAVSACASTAALVPLPTDEFEPAALRAETQWRHQVDQSMRVDFHRQQAFRWQGAGPSHAATIVSLVAWPDSGAAHCALALEQNGQRHAFDALAADADQPWSCDDAPAITSVDVDGDRVPDLLVLYPYRAPSGERFMLPLVFVYQPAQGALVVDEARTAALRARRQPVTDLRSMKQALQAR